MEQHLIFPVVYDAHIVLYFGKMTRSIPESPPLYSNDRVLDIFHISYAGAAFIVNDRYLIVSLLLEITNYLF
jgi:hypothetical protein